MTSIIKVQNIQYTDGDAALTIADGGGVTLPSALSAKGGAVFNEDSADVDFRVESNGNANMLFVDGGNDSVGIGISNPASYNVHADELVVGGTDGNRGITIVGGDDDYSILNLNRYSNTSATPNGAIEYNHTDNQMYIKAGGNHGVQINSNGSVNKPNQPCFRARRTNTAGTTQGFQGNIIFDSKTLDLGNNYTTSNGRFTAPVAGTYYFSHAGLGASGTGASTHNSGASWHLEFLKNGSRTGFQFYWYQGNPTAGGSQPGYINSYMDMVITLAANDYITIQLPDGTDSYYSDTSTYYDTYFQGFLIA